MRTPEVLMLLFVAAAAFAAPQCLPVKATYDEYTGWGQSPAIVDDVLSARLTVSNPVTGETYPAAGELLLKEKTGAGVGELRFDTDPSGSVRTWAIYLLDANGDPLTEEPEVVDILFGDDGDGAIVARASADIVVRTVRIKKKNVPASRAGSDDGTHEVAVEVADLGVRAAYVAFQELSSDGAPIGSHVDLEAMTAEVYAAYQGNLLDGIVPLDTWRSTVTGTAWVDGLQTTAKYVNGGAELEFAVDWYGPATDKGASPLGQSVYALDRVRRLADVCKGQQGFLVLNGRSQIFDTYDAAINVIIEGDARGWEVGGRVVPMGLGPKPVTETLLALDPSDTALVAAATFDLSFPKKPEAEGVRTVGIQPLTKEGKPLAAWLECTLTPTALSVTEGASTLNYVGECLRDAEGRAYVRGFGMTLQSDGTGSITAELLGLDWASAARLAFDVDGEDLGIGYVEGAASVALTSFSLDWTYATDPDGYGYALELWLWGASGVPSISIVGDGGYRWPDKEFDLSATDGGVYAKEKTDRQKKEEAEAIKAVLVEAGATVEVK